MKKIFKMLYLSLAFLCLLGIGGNLEAGTYTIPPCAFMPIVYETYPLEWCAYNNALLLSNTPRARNADFVAPLNLPNGITIKKITIYFTDENGADWSDIDIRILRYELSTGESEYLATCYTGELATVQGRRSLVLTGSRLHYKTINNNSYAYSIRVSFGLNTGGFTQLHEIAITY
jgi:hypothetical protein